MTDVNNIPGSSGGAAAPASTPSSLVAGLKAHDLLAWKRLAYLYAPLVLRGAGRRGLQANDADDVLQEVFASKREEDMGLFNWFSGSQSPAISDPEYLKNFLFEAVWAEDHRRLERTLRANRQVVLDHFPAWQKVPEALRGDPAAMRRYVQAMLAIAQLFAQRLGAPELLQRLMGGDRTNPLVQWQNGLGQAKQLMAKLRYAEARDLLTNLLIDVRGLQGSGVDTNLPITLGLLGECYFQSGQAEKALPHMEQALRLCEQAGDAEGIVAYLGNLYEAYRYLGQSEKAAGYVEQLAEALERQGRPDRSNPLPPAGRDRSCRRASQPRGRQGGRRATD